MSSITHSAHAFARSMLAALLLSLPAGAPGLARAGAPADGMLRVAGGDYQPFYKGKTGARTIPVGAFLLDRAPVSRREFLDFVTTHSRWRRSQVTPLFAERGYLSDWTGDLAPAGSPETPVTRVSWFAASAYCECQGKRLPTQAEWEWASERGAVAGFTGLHRHAPVPDPSPQQARRKLSSAGFGAYRPIRLASFEHAPRPAHERDGLRFAMGRGERRGLAFGDVWEWTSDFNTLLLADPSPDETSSSLFCGDGFRATDAKDYGGFLRFSLRSSLKANYALRNLGFRCAKDLP